MAQVVEVTLDKNGEATVRLYGHDIKIVAAKPEKKADKAVNAEPTK